MSFPPKGRGPPTLTSSLLEPETELCELSAEFVSAALVSSMLGFLSLPLHWGSFRSASTAWAFTKWGFCCAQPPPRRGQAKVVSARSHPSHGPRYMLGEFNFLGSVLPQQRFEMVGQCHSSEVYSASEGKYTVGVWGQAKPKWEASVILASSFHSLLSSPPSLP